MNGNDIIYWFFTALAGVFALYSLYYLVIALFGLKKPAARPATTPTTRFALLIAARNEEAVIGHLVDSLKAQNYPDDLYDIIVAPNNCSDDTRGVALAHGAKVFHHRGRVHSKGEVLSQAVDMLLAQNRHDAICVFDADNLVDPGFLQQMHDARQQGARVAQGFRDSKNPRDTAISTCYSVIYWMLSRFYNGGRERLGLSALVNGSGFMVDLGLLRTLGGWHTTTLTEDFEFSAQCLLAGERVHYVPGAVIFDEQPLTFGQSWKQRRRWSTGSVQSMERYLHALLRRGVTGPDLRCLDMALTFMLPLVQLFSLLLGGTAAVLSITRLLGARLFTGYELCMLGLLAAGIAVAACATLATVMVLVNQRGKLAGTGRGILFFAFFLLSWMPITILSLFVRTKSWDAIAHSRAVSLDDVRRAA